MRVRRGGFLHLWTDLSKLEYGFSCFNTYTSGTCLKCTEISTLEGTGGSSIECLVQSGADFVFGGEWWLPADDHCILSDAMETLCIQLWGCEVGTQSNECWLCRALSRLSQLFLPLFHLLSPLPTTYLPHQWGTLVPYGWEWRSGESKEWVRVMPGTILISCQWWAGLQASFLLCHSKLTQHKNRRGVLTRSMEADIKPARAVICRLG